MIDPEKIEKKGSVPDFHIYPATMEDIAEVH